MNNMDKLYSNWTIIGIFFLLNFCFCLYFHEDSLEFRNKPKTTWIEKHTSDVVIMIFIFCSVLVTCDHFCRVNDAFENINRKIDKVLELTNKKEEK